MANSTLVNQRSLVDKETERLALMEERQKLMDELGKISKEAVAWTKNAWWWSYQPNWWPLNWIYWVADRDIAKRWDKASARLQEINERLANMNKEAPTWPLKPNTEWVKEFINSNNFKTWWWTSWWSTTKWSTSKWNTNKWYWNANAVKQPEPTYVDPSGVTHTWMTQDEFDTSMKMYEADNQWWYENRRNQVVWANWATRWQIFDQALDKFLSNPDAFSEDQKQLLIKAWKELWYFNWTSETPTTSWTPTVAPTVAPTAQPTVTTPTQRRINNANDAYYAWQNAWRWVVL